MLLFDTLELYFGGPGSGCRGSNCGRNKGALLDSLSKARREGGFLTLYHGTNSRFLDSIKEKGLVPSGLYGKKIYLTPVFARAKKWASPTLDGKEKPVILEFRVPKTLTRRMVADVHYAGEPDQIALRGSLHQKYLTKVHYL